MLIMRVVARQMQMKILREYAYLARLVAACCASSDNKSRIGNIT